MTKRKKLLLLQGRNFGIDKQEKSEDRQQEEMEIGMPNIGKMLVEQTTSKTNKSDQIKRIKVFLKLHLCWI